MAAPASTRYITDSTSKHGGCQALIVNSLGYCDSDWAATQISRAQLIWIFLGKISSPDSQEQIINPCSRSTKLDRLLHRGLNKDIQVKHIPHMINRDIFTKATLQLVYFAKLLTKSAMTGCVANLYESLEKLDESYLQPNQNKDSLLKPTVAAQVTDPNFLLPDTNRKPEDQKLYYCSRHPGSVSHTRNSVCSRCSSDGYGSSYHLDKEVKFAVTSDSTSTDTPTSDQGGYVKGLVTYTVTDDLSVSPMSMVSVVGLLNRFNIKDFGVLKEKVVEFGIDEGIELLKASLFSKDALTAVFLVKDRDGAPRSVASFMESAIETLEARCADVTVS
uniref:Uncharacterized protein n=1 Tax=Salix viminalis TaxID=40686 RepID=A0A6N2MVA1_SALVM